MLCFGAMRRATVGGVLFCLTLAMPVLGDEGSSKDGDSDWKISVVASQDAQKEWQLDVVMEYHGEKPTELAYDTIPWKWPYAMTFCVADVPRGIGPVVPYSPKTFAGDRPEGHLTVKPGETLKGTIPLRSLFDLRESKWFRIPTRIVFWSYKPQGSNRVGGWLEIPQQNRPKKKRRGSGSEEWKLRVSVEEVISEEGVDSKEEASSKNWKWNFEIEYHGIADTGLGRWALPWYWNQSMIICLVPANGQRPDPFTIRSRALSDPPMSILKVKPGEVIRGEFSPYLFVNLNSREAIRNGPIMVFWAYRVKSSNWVGGWFEVDETQVP